MHRIDKDTSGLLVVAKTPDAKTDLGRQFFNKTTKREYMAVVWGYSLAGIRKDRRQHRPQSQRPPADDRIAG